MIAVGVDRELPQSRIHTRDHQAGKRIGRGALGALVGAARTVWGGCVAGGPLGCVVGAFLSPVGAVVDATVRSVQVDSIDL